ncbi:8-oxo-dGTP pyrophosphatase MutT (NUDIX family) [Bosea sp. OAE506]|uniref:NUDIX hydrolase n=1 Tax=Bosea sp. OAE506 TaxID=2663870 RepID=UPI0019DF565A
MGWTVLSSRSVIRDRWIDLRADDCVTPSGQSIAPYYVLTYPDWVHVVALNARDEVLLVRQYRHGAGESFLELPGGVIDGDEAVETAARRELAEETGYEAGAIALVSSLHPNPAIQNNQVHVCIATEVVAVGPPRLDVGEEGLTLAPLPLQTVLDGLATGILGQSLHVTSLLLGLAALGRINLCAVPPPAAVAP